MRKKREYEMSLSIITGASTKGALYDHEIQFEHKEINVNNRTVFDYLVGISLLLSKSFKSVCKHLKRHKTSS